MPQFPFNYNQLAYILSILSTSIKYFAVERVAAESYKTPSEVVKFENYHHLLNCLSCVKVAALESEKKDVKARYTRNLQSYVTSMLGRPLEKLSVSNKMIY